MAEVAGAAWGSATGDAVAADLETLHGKLADLSGKLNSTLSYWSLAVRSLSRCDWLIPDSLVRIAGLEECFGHGMRSSQGPQTLPD